MLCVAKSRLQLEKAAATVARLNPEKQWRIEVTRHQERRTISQNKRYWAAVMELARETGHSKEEIHEAMRRKFLETIIVTLGDEEIPVTQSSAKLGKKIFSEFTEQVIAFASSEFGIVA